MCLAVFAFDTCSKFSLVLAFNRDEDFTRETKPAHWWEDLDAFRQAFGDTDKILLGGETALLEGRGFVAAG
eukprot:jgi/Picre1/35840/NNA_003300.t1